MGELFSPIRTLDPNHVATTRTSTSYSHLLDHPTEKPETIRLAIVTSALDAGLPPLLQETQLLVRSDAYHLGDRCTKRGCTKGICDLCHVFLGQRTPETLRHILLECPFTVPVLAYVWRTIFSQLADPTIRTHSAHLTARAFIERYERRLLFGVAAYDTLP